MLNDGRLKSGLKVNLVQIYIYCTSSSCCKTYTCTCFRDRVNKSVIHLPTKLK